MKDNNLIIGAVVVVVIVLGIVLFSADVNNPELATNTTDTTTEVTQTQTAVKTTVTTPPKVESFTNIFPHKGNFKCVYEEVTPSTRSTNIMYFSDGKMRVEFRTFSGASNIMFYDGQYMYNWVEGQSTGKISIPKSISDFPAIIPKDITQGKVLGSGLNSASWDCQAWAKDPSLVTKPSYVKFY